MYFLIVAAGIWIFGAIIFGLATRDAEKGGEWALCGFVPMFLIFMITMFVSTDKNRDFDKLSVPIEDVKMPIAGLTDRLPNQLALIPKANKLGFDLLKFDRDGMSLFVQPVIISIEPGKEFYVRKITRRAPPDFFHFRQTMTKWYLVIPESVLK